MKDTNARKRVDMWQLKEFVPEGLKDYVKLVSAKLRRPGCFIGSPLVSKGALLGRGCSVSRGAQLADGVSLGDFSYVNCGAIVASGKFGRFCSVGPYAMVGLPEHPTSFLSTSPKLYGPANLFSRPSRWEDFPAPPVIGSDVWIGGSAFVRQGIRIGHGAIVAAGAVVTKDVPPYGIVGGVPAKLIRFRFEPEVVESLIESRWWEQSLNRLSSLAESFQEPYRKERECARVGDRP